MTQTTAVRTDRLGELVAHLTGCGTRTASAAVQSATDATGGSTDRLEVVAHALVTLRHTRRS
jgi:hypothetical protein